ncbi:MBL fold metallo-hydrolase [Heyndrickxia coagulans]|uniref:MBL fold metallo-hydrolase n=2 Tax=Heyndrickxia coagulans TaxID=1398 RepID=UPI00138A14C5|nr:MBL fold metallo-hydrolase [Heyndrickxia coagulans]
MLFEIQETKVWNEMIAFWHLGQSGVLLKGPEGMICIDPYLTYRIETSDPGTEFKRAFASPLEPEMLKGAGAVLVTHHHDDHLDLETLSRLNKVSPETKWIVPAPHTDMLTGSPSFQKVIGAVSGKPIKAAGFTILPVAAAHTEYENDDKGNDLYLGYFLICNGVRLYHSGDNVVTDELLKAVCAFHPDVAFLPINGIDYFRTKRNIVGNMTFRESADFGHAAGIDLIVPVHYDLFPNNRDNPVYFVDYLSRHYPSQKFHMMVPGERFIYVK